MKQEEKNTAQEKQEYDQTEEYSQNRLERTSTEKYIKENYNKAWEDDRL